MEWTGLLEWFDWGVWAEFFQEIDIANAKESTKLWLSFWVTFLSMLAALVFGTWRDRGPWFHYILATVFFYLFVANIFSGAGDDESMLAGTIGAMLAQWIIAIVQFRRAPHIGLTD